jgi:ATP-dependent Clp protease ATP-binding subunit ClpB
VFHSLTEEDLKKIVDIQLDRLRARLAERRIALELTDEAKTHLALAGYDPVYGARPLKRAIQREIETPLSRLILQGDVRDNSVLRADVSGGVIVFSPVSLAAEADATH